MAGVTSPATLIAAGTRQAFAAVGSTPTVQFCNRVTVQLISGTNVYLGLQAPIGVGNTVSSIVYNVVLSSAAPSFTIGPFGPGNGVNLADTWWDSDTSSAKVALAPLQV
jgi:hypothetical protein